MFFSEHIVESY